MIDEPGLMAEPGRPAPTRERPLTFNGFLVRVLGVAIVAHVVVFAIYHATMKKFDDSLHIHKSQFLLPNLRGDVRLAMMSRVVKNNVCEFYPDKSCNAGGTESNVVESLRKQPLSASTNQLLENHRYGSAYEIARDLLIAGEDQEATKLLDNSVFDSDQSVALYKANFANTWYLAPAAAYVAHHREYDSLNLFKQYVSIMRNPVANHHWLSYPGLDATDIPPLVDLFCTNSDQLALDECLLGLLKVTASQISRFSYYGPQTDDENGPSSDLAHIYASLPKQVKSDAMQDYFTVWSWDGHSLPEPQHGDLSNDQLAAWKYAFAIRLIAAAPKSESCADTMARSEGMLASVVSAGDSMGYFAVPAQHRVDFIEKNRVQACNTEVAADAK